MYFKKFRFRIVFVILAMIVTSAAVRAQEKPSLYSDQQWIQYYEQVKLNNRWTILADAGYRRKDWFANMSQYIVRVATGYQLNKYMRVAAGFANLGFYTSNTLSKLEFRPFEEWMITNKLSTVKVQQRFRFEERFFKVVENGSIQSSSIFNFRFRYRLMFNIHLLNLTSSVSCPKLSLNAGDELLVNTG
ncbi:MAG: DUF2490 domain-containing protein [Bacteroidales bacterium]|nr:DUF2490 domain-containing protein [Bacteroidales bacterium]